MIIACPSCETKFQIAVEALGPAGRSVRCARCKYTWLQAPREEEAPVDDLMSLEDDAGDEEYEEHSASDQASAEISEPEPKPEPETVPNAMSEETTSAGDLTAEDDGNAGGDGDPQDDEFGPDLNQAEADNAITNGSTAGEFDSLLENEPMPILAKFDENDLIEDTDAARFVWVKWLILFSLLVFGGFAVMFFQSQFVAAWPPAQKLYEWIEAGREIVQGEEFNLDITDITSEHVRESGRLVLVVRGKISNRGKKPRDIPQLRIYLLDSKSKPLYDWQVPLSRDRLGPAEVLSFTSRLPNPNENGRKLAVRFDP